MNKKILSTVVVMFVMLQAYGQVTFNSVEDVWKYADDNNVTIRIARYDADKSRLAKKQSYSAFMPQVTANGTYTDNMAIQTTLLPGVIVGKPDGVYVPVKFGQKYIYSGNVTAQLDVLNVQSWFNVRTARISAEMSKDSLSNTRKNIYQQIATQYYSVLLMTEAARLATNSELLADSVFQSVSRKFAEGTVSKANVDLSKMNLERAQQTNITAQYQIQTAKNSLKILLDMQLTDSMNITASLSRTIEDAGKGTFTEDPAVKIAYNAMRISMSQYKGGNATFLPTLAISYSNTTQQNDNKFEPFSGGPSWFPAEYWSLKASWNIFSGGSKYYQSRRNKIAIEERKLQFESAQRQSVINDENLRLNYAKTAALLTKTEDVMHLSFDNYTHISNRYTEGLSSLDDKLNAFSDYIGYQNQYLNSLSDMLVQLYQIKIRQLSF